MGHFSLFEDPPRFGRNVKAARLKRGLTQKKLADLVGLCQTSLCHIEKGKYGTSLGLYEKICRVLKLPNPPLL